MLVYTQRSVLRGDVIGRGLNLFGELLDKSNQAMLFLFSPEDTSGREDLKKRSQIIQYSEFHIPGIIKALIWTAASISTTMLVGQLG